MPIIKAIGFDGNFAEIELTEAFKEAFKEKVYFEKIYIEVSSGPLFFLKTGEKSPYFIVIDERSMKKRAEDIMETIGKAYPGYFVGIQYFDETNL